MKKSRIIALLTVVAMIMSVVPAYAYQNNSGIYDDQCYVDENNTVYEMVGDALVENGGFEDGSLTSGSITTNTDVYKVMDVFEDGGDARSGRYYLKALKGTKGADAINYYVPVTDPSASYYVNFFYKNEDETVGRRPRVTFAFTGASMAVPTKANEFTEATNAWVAAGTTDNDCGIEYSTGDWIQCQNVITGNGNADDCKYVVLSIYGLTEDSCLDAFKLYQVKENEEKTKELAVAVAEFEAAMAKLPEGPLAGEGKLELPVKLSNGYAVEWMSSSKTINVTYNGEEYTEDYGTYKSFGERQLAVLTGYLFKDDIMLEYEYPYIIESMFTAYINWVNDYIDSIESIVEEDLELPSVLELENHVPMQIEWTCTDTEGNPSDVIAPDGTFTAPELTKSVNLTAKIIWNDDYRTVKRRVRAVGGNIVDEGLHIYYDFEKSLEGTELQNSSTKGSKQNATVTGVTIKNGYATFSGKSSTITLNSSYARELKSSYSVSMWVKLDPSIASNTGMYRFFDFGGGSYTSQFLRYVPNTGELSFMDRQSAGSGSNWAINTVVPSSELAGEWKLFTLTYDMENRSYAYVRLFLDGAEIANSSGCTYLDRSLFDVASGSSETGYIGLTQWNNADNPSFKGSMDEIRVYNRAITEDEVKILFENTFPTIDVPVTIQYYNTDNEKIADDVVVNADANAEFEVPASYKSLPSSSEGDYRFVYKYLSSKSTDTITVSDSEENICKLVFELVKQPIGSNLIENGSFENGTAGWTNRQGTDITGATVEYDNSIGANVMRLATLGQYDTQNIGTIWNVEIGKEYTISFDIYTGEALDSNNYQYNRLSDGYSTGDKGQRANSGKDIIAWGGSLTANSWTHFEKEFTATTTVLYFQSSWSAGEMKFANFVLEEAGASSDVSDPDTDKTPISIRYIDVEGNLIKEEIVKVNPETTREYTVTDAQMKLTDVIEGGARYKYKYVEVEDVTKLTTPISLKNPDTNVCVLVYELVAKTAVTNLVPDGSFEDADGNFSWGTWQTPRGDGEYANKFFKDNCSDWFYIVNRDTGSSVLYGSSIAADDYALGTRWNDGADGLCSLANFIKVEAGKKYYVAYDYKHNVAGTSSSTICTTFQTTNTVFAPSYGANKNNPKSVTTSWQTNAFTIEAPEDGYIYFHFYWLGSGGSTNTSANAGGGPHWSFDNFEVYELLEFEGEITYADGQASIVAKDGTTGYLVQAMYDNEGALTDVIISEELTLSQEVPVVVDVNEGAKLMLVKDLVSLEPLVKAVIAE